MTRLRLLAPFVLLCGLGLLLAFQPVLWTGFGGIPGDTGDARLEHGLLEHGYKWLTGDPAFPSFWNGAFFFPAPRTLAYSDPLLSVVSYYALFRGLGFAADTSFQLWLLLLGTLNFVAAALFLRGPLRFSPIASAFGACLYAFGASRVAQLNHPQLLPTFFSLFAVHALVRAFQADRAEEVLRGTPAESSAPGDGVSSVVAGGRLRPWHWLAVFCAAFVMQLYAVYTHAWFLFFAGLVAFGWGLALKSLRGPLLGFLRRHVVALAVGMTLVGLASLPMALVYLRTAKEVGFRQFAEASAMVPRVTSWFFLGDSSWLYGWTTRWVKLPMGHEHRLSLGFVTTGVLLWAFWRRRREPVFGVVGATMLTLVFLSLRYRGGFMPWEWLFHHFPGANGIRAVSRIGMLLLVPGAMALAAGVERLGPARLGALLGLFCLLEQGQRVFGYDKHQVREGDARLRAAVSSQGCEAPFFVLYTQDDGRPNADRLVDAMWVHFDTGRPTVNGYSGAEPPGWTERLHRPVAVDAAAEAPILADLDAWKARHPSLREVCVVRYPPRSPPP